MRVRSVLSVTVLALFLQPVGTAVSGSAVATDIVEYQCTTTGATEKQSIKVKIELTMPATATTGEQMSIGWQATYADDTGLKAPSTGLTGDTSLYAYASIRGITGLTSATGVGTLGTVGADQVIPLPATQVSLATTATTTAGTGTVRPAAMNFGTAANAPSIQCEVQNPDALTTYPLTVTSADQPTPDPESPETETETDTDTGTETGTETDTGGNGKVEETPAGSAATGGGGERGPDGRMFLLAGSLLILASAAGLLFRRRTWG